MDSGFTELNELPLLTSYSDFTGRRKDLHLKT